MPGFYFCLLYPIIEVELKKPAAWKFHELQAKKSQQTSPLSRKESEKEKPSKTERFYPVITLLLQTLHKTSMASSPSMPAKVERRAQTSTLVRLWWATLTTPSGAVMKDKSEAETCIPAAVMNQPWPSCSVRGTTWGCWTFIPTRQ